jgi:hypothetical protein
MVCSQTKVTKKDIRSKYETFEYQDVIRLSDIYLYNNPGVSVQDSLEVLTMKAVSEYSLNEVNNSEKTFIDILKIDRQYNLDPTEISPKIISFYQEIKTNYHPFIEEPEKDGDESKNESIDLKEINRLRSSIYTSAISRSILLPGLGHLYLENSAKGWILTSISSMTLGAMVYFIFDTRSKEHNYLNETEPDLISSLYDTYNTSYKIRNVLIICYAAIWLYSQLDLLYMSDDLFNKKFEATITTEKFYGNEVIFKFNLKVLL